MRILQKKIKLSKLLDRDSDDDAVILVVKIPNLMIALTDSNSNANKSPLTKTFSETFRFNPFLFETLSFLV